MANALYEEQTIRNPLSITSLFTFSRRRFRPDYVFKGEGHDFYEVVCAVSGKVGVTADKNVYVLSSSLIVHTPNEFHKIWSDGQEADVVIFSFRANAFPTLKERVFSLSPRMLAQIKEIQSDATQVFSIRGDTMQPPKEEMEIEASKIVKRLELFLLSVFADDPKGETKYVSRSAENYQRILSVMEEHLGESLKTEELARICSVSVPTMEKTIYRYLGCGAMAYYNLMKMKRATEYLLNGSSVKETALSLGFSNQNYFSASFKKWSGKSPVQWKRENGGA